MVDLYGLVDRLGENAPFPPTKFLISYKGHRPRLIRGNAGDIVEKLLLDCAEGLLAARKVNGHHPSLAVALGQRVRASVPPSERMARIDIREALILKDLGTEALRRRLPGRPVPQAMPSFIPPFIAAHASSLPAQPAESPYGVSYA
jgi:hypothetical protein